MFPNFFFIYILLSIFKNLENNKINKYESLLFIYFILFIIYLLLFYFCIFKKVIVSLYH